MNALFPCVNLPYVALFRDVYAANLVEILIIQRKAQGTKATGQVCVSSSIFASLIASAVPLPDMSTI
jgi:hypothetical protein